MQEKEDILLEAKCKNFSAEMYKHFLARAMTVAKSLTFTSTLHDKGYTRNTEDH